MLKFNSEIEDIIRDFIAVNFPYTQYKVVQMDSPTIMCGRQDLVSRTERYNLILGPLDKIKNTILTVKAVNKGKQISMIIIGLYGYYPTDGMIRYALKTIY